MNVIALDGPAGSGKSTISKIISEKLNYIYLSTGSVYRAVTLYCIQNKIELSEVSISNELSNINIKLDDDNIYLNDIDITSEISDNEISKNVSFISSLRKVRDYANNIFRDYANNKNVVLDGRDIGTVVFPDAKYKFFLTADAKIRAERRIKDLVDSKITKEELIKELIKRDEIDSQREIDPLRKAEDAIEIDATHLSIEEVANKIISYIN